MLNTIIVILTADPPTDCSSNGDCTSPQTCHLKVPNNGVCGTYIYTNVFRHRYEYKNQIIFHNIIITIALNIIFIMHTADPPTNCTTDGDCTFPQTCHNGYCGTYSYIQIYFDNYILK